MQARKTLSAMIAAVAILPIFTRCDAAVDFWDERTLTVNIPADAPATAGSDDQLVDLNQDPEIKDKLSAIHSVEIPEIWLDVPSVDPSNLAKYASGSLDVRGPNDAADAWIHVGDYKDLIISAGGKIEVVPSADEQATLDKVRGWATTAPYQFHVRFSGAFEDANKQPLMTGPVNFQLHSRIHLVANVGL